MSEWQPIDTAPTATVILLYGRVHDGAEHDPQGCIRVTGYWEDGAKEWRLMTPGWEGPAFRPTHWAEIPAPPSEGRT
jgi:hypothetical protein